MALHHTHGEFWYFFRCYKSNSHSWHTSNFESVNKKPSFLSIQRKKNSIVSVSIHFQYNVFLYFLQGQKHKDSKWGIMINVSKSRLVKNIFSNIHKISDICANSFCRYIMIAQYMRNVFTFYYIQVSLEKWCFWED